MVNLLQIVAPGLIDPGQATSSRVSCVISSAAGTVRLPSTDPNVEFADAGMVQWSEIPVSGAESILGVAGVSRPKVDLKGYLFDYRGVTAVEQRAMLARICASEHAVSVAWGSVLSAATWVITGHTVTAERLYPGTNDLRQAAWTLSLTRYAVKAVKPASTTKPSSRAKKPPRKVAVRKGETLAKFAARVTGDASTMALIAADNHIRDPRKVPAGTVLTVNY